MQRRSTNTTTLRGGRVAPGIAQRVSPRSRPIGVTYPMQGGVEAQGNYIYTPAQAIASAQRSVGARTERPFSNSRTTYGSQLRPTATVNAFNPQAPRGAVGGVPRVRVPLPTRLPRRLAAARQNLPRIPIPPLPAARPALPLSTRLSRRPGSRNMLPPPPPPPSPSL